jgi:hypothetical protein
MEISVAGKMVFAEERANRLSNQRPVRIQAMGSTVDRRSFELNPIK